MSETNLTVDICIASFKRPEMLANLLSSLDSQISVNRKCIRIIVVDNDESGSARNIVDQFRQNTDLVVVYDIEPEQNISLARNRCIQNAEAEYIIFIDDDERAAPDWLKAHIETAVAYNADVVTGPVIKEFPRNVPEWIVKGGFFRHQQAPTGTTLIHCPTGNTLIAKACLTKVDYYFDPNYGLTGGGDTEFFYRLSRRGAKLIWCQDAIVYETVTDNRLTMGSILSRAFRSGQAFSRIFIRSRSVRYKIIWYTQRILYLLTALCITTVIWPFGKHHGIQYLKIAAANLGKLLGSSPILHEPYRQA
jgi:succinoglycan biosynthesis protein ExoM